MKSFLFYVCLVFQGFFFGHPLHADDKPLNVLFIVADDLNNDLGCYGHPMVQTPHIDRLAQMGMRFDRAYCQNPLCNPSRVSFLSGLRPETTGVHTLFDPPRRSLPNAVMLPEHFRRHGYFTAMSGKVYHTGKEMEDPQSWDVEFREFGKNPRKKEIERSGEAGPTGSSLNWAVLNTIDEQTPDGQVADRAVQLIEQATADEKPFFMAVGFRRPHSPYAAPRRYFDLYPPAKVDLSTMHQKPIGIPAAAVNLPLLRQNLLSESDSREVIAAYLACVSFVDAQVGELWQAMDRLKLWDNTVVVFFSDHGYHLGDHGGLWHKATLFEQATRVPLIVHAPGMRAVGKPCARLVELVDLYPTLVDLCALPMPAGLEGRSFRPLLNDPQQPWKQAAYSLTARDDGVPVRQVKFFGRSVRTERWRYTEWDEGRKGVELYDEENDPHELLNLADKPEHAAIQAELRALLRGMK